jgi:predicted dehydrogenase
MPDPDPIRVGVVGLGVISPAHLRGYATAPGARLAGVCDLDHTKAEVVAAEFEATAYADYESMLSSRELDALALLLPHQLHYGFAKAALESGKHVIVEKPLTVTEADATDLIASAASRDLTLALSENTRFVTAYLEAEKIVGVGDLGTVRFIRGFIPDQVLRELETTEWKRQNFGAAAIIDAAPHMLYLIKWLFGDVESLQAFGRNYLDHIKLENHAVIAGRLLSGALFSVEICSVTEFPRGERLEIYGSEAALIVDQVLNPPAVLYRGERDLTGTPVPGAPYEITTWKANSIMAGTRDFVEAISKRRPPAVDLRDARYTVMLIECAYESIAQGGQVVDIAGRWAASSTTSPAP